MNNEHHSHSWLEGDQNLVWIKSHNFDAIEIQNQKKQMMNDPQETTRTVGNNADAITQNSATSAAGTTSVSSSAPPSASSTAAAAVAPLFPVRRSPLLASSSLPIASLLDSSLAHLHQQPVQAPAQQATSTSTSTSEGTLDTVSFLQQLQQMTSSVGHQPMISGLAGYLPSATTTSLLAQHQAPTPAAATTASSALQAQSLQLLRPFSQNQSSLPPTAAAQADLATYLGAPTPATGTNQLQQLLSRYLPPQSSVASMPLPTHAPPSHEQSQVLHLLLQDIRNKIQAVAIILSQHHQAGSVPRPASDATINQILAMLWQQHQADVANKPSSDSDAINRIAALLTQSSSQRQHHAAGGDGVTSRNQNPLGTSTNQIAQLLLSQQVAPSQQPGSTLANQMEELIRSMAYNANPHASNQAADFASINRGNTTVAAAEALFPNFVKTEPSPPSSLSNPEDNQNERDMKPHQSKEERWTARYKELKEFQQNHGHCRVPHGYAGNRQLSWWVMNQRAQFQQLRRGKNSWLSEDRVELLKEIGFDWSPIPGKPKSKSDGQDEKK